MQSKTSLANHDATDQVSAPPHPRRRGGWLLGTSVRGRLIRLFAGAQLLWIVCIGVTLHSVLHVSSTDKQQEAIFTVFQTERAAYEGWLTDDDQSNMSVALAALHQPGQASLIRTTWSQVQQGYDQAESSLAVLSRTADPSMRGEVARTVADVARYNAFTIAVGNAVFDGNAGRAVELMTVGNAAISNQTQNDFDALGTTAAAAAHRLANSVHASVASTFTLLLVLAPLIILLTTAACVFLLTMIRRAMQRLVGVARKVARGEIDHESQRCGLREIDNLELALDELRDSEVALADAADAIAAGHLDTEMHRRSDGDRLGIAFAGMRDRLIGVLGQLATASQTVTEASRHLASSSQEAGHAVGEIAHAVGDVAAGATRQASSVENARSVTQDVVDSARQSAEHVRETNQASERASQVASDGVQAATRASAAMTSVQAATAAVTEQIRELGEKSERIGGIVEAIAGISEQTNLLALNAAIEAARAGEQGRGFAVVAEEVRKLAEESRDAAASIELLIGEIQDQTTRVIEVVELGATRTSEGVITVEQAREQFQAIGDSVDDMTSRMEGVTRVIEQITESTQSILTDVSDLAAIAEQSSASTEQVSASMQETSATTEEIAASAQELARTAMELETLLEQFTFATNN